MKKLVAISIIFLVNVSIAYLIIAGMQDHRQPFGITLLKSAFFSFIPTVVLLMYNKRKSVNND